MEWTDLEPRRGTTSSGGAGGGKVIGGGEYGEHARRIMGAVARENARGAAAQGGGQLDVVLEVLVRNVGRFAEDGGVEGNDGEDAENQADGRERVFAADELRRNVVDVVEGDGRDIAAGGTRLTQGPRRGGGDKEFRTSQHDVEEDVRVEEQFRLHGANLSARRSSRMARQSRSPGTERAPRANDKARSVFGG